VHALVGDPEHVSDGRLREARLRQSGQRGVAGAVAGAGGLAEGGLRLGN
jgi:hypothetical protein